MSPPEQSERSSASDVAIVGVVLAALVTLAAAADVYLYFATQPHRTQVMGDVAFVAAKELRDQGNVTRGTSGPCPAIADVLRATPSVRPQDPWDHPWHIACGPSSVEISSAGPDGVLGTLDDIVAR